ncbi:MAG: ATP-binding protein, partial [Oscillospiraceae bacterium]
RALINLLENSFYAVDKQCGLIELSIDGIVREDRPLIRFSVRDNGKGIPRELLDSIWEKGFSTRSSHGLGLSFVEKVIKSNDGEISIDSTEGEGTLACILIPACEQEGDSSHESA